MAPILVVPGYGNSGPGHWQTLWQARAPGARRVEMPSWDAPKRRPWIAAVDAAVAACAEPPVLVAHSLGCLAVAHWSLGSARPVRAALLVAPCDPEAPSAPPALRDFAPVPAEELPFPTLLVASVDDPFARFSRAEEMARTWGARLVCAGHAGHLNVAAGFGPWPFGEALLRELTR